MKGSGGLWQPLSKPFIVTYEKPEGIEFRMLIEAICYLNDITDEDTILEFLHFKLMQQWEMI